MSERGGPEAPQGRLIDAFFAEALESIARGERAAMDLEAGTDDQGALQDMFRSIHTLKGSASYVGASSIKDISHAFEDLLDSARKNSLNCPRQELVDRCFEVIDALRVQVRAMMGQAEAVDHGALVAAMHEQHAVQSSREDHASSRKGTEKATEEAYMSVLKRQAAVLEPMRPALSGKSRAPSAKQMKQIRKVLKALDSASDYMLQTDLREVVAAAAAAFAGAPAAADAEAPVTEQVANAFARLFDALQERFDPVSAPEHPAPANEAEHPVSRAEVGQGGTKAAGAKPAIRVDQRYVDALMSLTGELVIAKNSLQHSRQQVEDTFGQGDKAVRALRSAVARLGQISEDLQHNVRMLRMVPVGVIFERAPRILRDLHRQTGKDVSLVSDGEKVLIDREIADEIGEPILHLIRNAVDHGIESLEQRRACGKPDQGRITLRSYYENQSVVLEVSDDGGGLDLQAIVSAARSKGLIDDTFDATDVARVHDLVFAPGLSTKAAVSEVSGRGVGLDVVRTNIMRLGGAVQIGGGPTIGTTIRLRLPLSTSVVSSILISLGEELFALPIEAVSEVLKVQAKQKLPGVGRGGDQCTRADGRRARLG